MMTAKSFQSGWPIVFIGDHWVYEDTGQPVTSKRSCRHCKRMPTPEGYDACIGHIPGTVSACCGHGSEPPYTLTYPQNTMISNPWVEDGHLGGYIPGGDPCTFCPSLWEQLITDYQVKSVLDIGCAEGQAMKWFADHGCQVLGIEGCKLAICNHLLPQFIVPHDFTTGPWTGPRVDLVWCCEVLEHIEEKYLPNLLAAMNGRVVATTAANLGQTGYHHVNCQPVSYWIDKFAEIGFRYDEARTQFYKQQGKAIGWWFYHNGLIFVKK